MSDDWFVVIVGLMVVCFLALGLFVTWAVPAILTTLRAHARRLDRLERTVLLPWERSGKHDYPSPD